MPIATKLILSFLLIAMLASLIFTVVGMQLISNRIVTEAQETVKRDLNSAREIYASQLRHINDVVRLTADRYIIITALGSGDLPAAAVELLRIKNKEGLDILNIADTSGTVLLRANNWSLAGDSQARDELVAAVLRTRTAVAATAIVSGAELAQESSDIARKAYLSFIDTPMARSRTETEQTSGMMMKSAAPILDYHGNFIGVVYGGTLLNRDYGIVDQVKQTVFQGLKYKGDDIGTATIFQDDVRISTNVTNADGTRAIGTRVMEEVYDKVILHGEPWIGRAFVVNNWYITAYEPIEDFSRRRIGILYVGILEQKYTDIRTEVQVVFLGITILGALVTMALAYSISRSISMPVRQLVAASRRVADGDLDARVEIDSSDEIGALAHSFNQMAAALQQRDHELEEFTKSKIMESERLALIGQLAAGVAHELNNPLQGIVTYSHMLLESCAPDEDSRSNLEKIVTQANRCSSIVRGLLDFSRQRKSNKTLYDVNKVLRQCVSLLENQVLFHNIEIHGSFASDLPLTVLDPSQLERVFMNIIINAAEAMEGKGRLALATRWDSRAAQIEITFTDSGPGISPENLKRVFSPFFTTKDAGHGVGLGLAISYGIVKEHNGDIRVENLASGGAKFLVRLPVDNDIEGLQNGF
ncbi:MAG TPA: cache domain-containing protein [Anaerolineales bacterium]|nr:cache domain-containing protein [Anaerolineales bacterium]